MTDDYHIKASIIKFLLKFFIINKLIITSSGFLVVESSFTFPKYSVLNLIIISE